VVNGQRTNIISFTREVLIIHSTIIMRMESFYRFGEEEKELSRNGFLFCTVIIS